MVLAGGVFGLAASFGTEAILVSVLATGILAVLVGPYAMAALNANAASEANGE
ncbi:hypothetical protein [Natronococcus wangiae]|uniref:hypothetical protein n=1 Tax=Natronococcus wangiae TaxID=3068275 RepID=UPI00273DA0F2|nr:hypothetical protein [Natronococcus sp. AD5]